VTRVCASQLFVLACTDKLSTDSKIDLLDAPEVVAKKIRKAECVPKEVEGNGVLALVEYVILPVSGLRNGTREFKVERRDAEPLVYNDIKQVQEDYRADVVCSTIVSNNVTIDGC
jgi:tyrosyl-tRNA synthetase